MAEFGIVPNSEPGNPEFKERWSGKNNKHWLLFTGRNKSQIPQIWSILSAPLSLSLNESSGDATQLTRDTTSPGSGAHQDTTEEGIRDLTQMPPAPESAMDTDKADPIFGGALTSPRSTGSADDLTTNFARAEIVSQVNIL